MIHLDFETYSETPIKHGTYRYLADCEAMVLAYAFDEEPVQVWDITVDPRMPHDLEMMLEDDGEVITAHNAMFDRGVFNLSKNLRRPIRLERWRCTMVRALSHSLPGGLELLCELMNVPVDMRKMAIGRQLVQLFCKPRPKNSTIRRATRFTHPEEWAQFIEYARYDVEAMRVLHHKLPKWNYSDVPGTVGARELALWHRDQRINDRGMCVDVPMAKGVIAAVDKEQARLKLAGEDATYGGVESLTQRDVLLEYILRDYGIELPDLKGSTLERRIQDPDLPIELRDLLALRLQSVTTSTSKYRALIRGVSDDGRLRGTMQFNGASRTGRNTGRVFQPLNMPRPDKAYKPDDIEAFIASAKEDLADLAFPDIMGVASTSIRGTIIAPPGRKLIVSDLSNIEGRMAAWLSGEEWKLQAFRDFDNGIGADLYKVAYAKSFRIEPEEVDDGDQRQVGKVQELMLQYEGGVGAFVTGAATYRIDLEKMAEAAYDTLPTDTRKEAEEFLAWAIKEKRPTYGLSERAFVTCETFKRLWRRAHPNIASNWKQLKETVGEAIAGPGRTLTCRRLKIRVDGKWLRIVLPGGRALCYSAPRVNDRGDLSYMGMNQYTRQWSRIKTYGGKLLENITQAASRDGLTDAEEPVEKAGYNIVLTVYDELATETPDTPEYTPAGLGAIMTKPYTWAPDLPLAYKAFETYRYRKD